MKPHMRFIKGRWKVWRDRSACPWSLPTVIRRGFREALKAHFEYVGELEKIREEI